MMKLFLTKTAVQKAAFVHPPPTCSWAMRSFASVGDQLPSVDLHLGFPPKFYNLADYAKGKKMILLGLPGAL
jgi:hypothetical protein